MERKLCHFCAQRRERVVGFNMPEAVELPSGRRKLMLCTLCLETLDTIATESENIPNRAPLK